MRYRYSLGRLLAGYGERSYGQAGIQCGDGPMGFWFDSHVVEDATVVLASVDAEALLCRAALKAKFCAGDAGLLRLSWCSGGGIWPRRAPL